MSFNRLEDYDASGQTALVRVDFNLPRDGAGTITDDTRLRSALPTIKHLRAQGAKIVLLSHFGRPKGEVVEAMSLKFVVPALEAALGEVVAFQDDFSAPNAPITLMENTRFHPGETKGDLDLAEQYASMGDIFVMDAFSAAHRDHSSSAGIAEFLDAYAGLAMARELDHLSQGLTNPKRPVMAIVGGAKVSTKIDLLQNLVTRLDILVIGGGMANTFLYAQGHAVGSSLAEKDQRGLALEILQAASEAGCRVILPTDVVLATEFAPNPDTRVTDIDDVTAPEMILDVGPATVTEILDAVDQAETLIWNGPLGAFETPPFDTSTIETAKYVAKTCKQGDIVAVAGGGDTVAALNQAGVADNMTFVSTAGGAFLEWMEGKTLPGVNILNS